MFDKILFVHTQLLTSRNQRTHKWTELDKKSRWEVGGFLFCPIFMASVTLNYCESQGFEDAQSPLHFLQLVMKIISFN